MNEKPDTPRYRDGRCTRAGRPLQSQAVATVAAVSFLNATPLVDGLDKVAGVDVIRAVPSRLLTALVTGHADIALCPTIDFQRSPLPLAIVPAGGISSAAATMTVRVFSRRPIAALDRIAVDSDSHTSVALLQIVLEARFGRRPELVPLPGPAADWAAAAMLLIGDKVVTCKPPATRYPYQLDLGRAWSELTGLPFVFATWMSRADTGLGSLPAVLAELRELNTGRLEEIVAAHAARLGWRTGPARRYLGQLLHHTIGDRELAAIELFWRECHRLGLIECPRPMRLYDDASRIPRSGQGPVAAVE